MDMEMSTRRGAHGRSLALIPSFRGAALAALSAVMTLASIAGGQTEKSVRGIVLAEDGQPIPGVSVHGSKRYWPYKQDKGTTDKKGEFYLENAGTVVHFSKSGLQPLTFVLKPGATQVRIVMKPAANDLTFRACAQPDSTQKLVGWGKYGLHFAVPKDGVQIFGGSPDVDYVRYVVKPDKSDSYLELWFGPYSISTEPDEEQFRDSVDFSQRNLVSAKGNVVGMDSWGWVSKGLKWRHAGAFGSGAIYRDADKEFAILFDKIIESICWTDFPRK